ncbi:MAG: LytTR family DNA-binding domain-containing protein [Terrimicrobiaceae bacterium]|nr:LytTR family DNA-binding domain-containing protein [Terrimicrobiaceae bacterium]
MNLPELRAVIVDDEPPAREVLQELLREHSHVKVIGEANSVAAATELCLDLQPNLIFLDVQMRDGDGFDLLPKLDPIPAIIFVTAYDEFAVRAFQVNAVDYLVKPVSPERLAHALQRIVRQPPTVCASLSEDDKIFLRTDTQMRVAFVMEISAIEAQENYSRVCFVDGSSMLIRRSMSEWERILPKPHFLRTHRSFIVNIQAVKKVVMNGRDELDVEIAGCATPIRLGRRSSTRLRQALRRPNALERAAGNDRPVTF